MAAKYYALLTNIGAAKLANATALGAKIEITQMAVGDGNGALPTPNPAQTTLLHEHRRAPLNMLTIDPSNANQMIAEQVIPEDVGGWWIREIGLFDKDGDMIAVANCAETYKPKLQEGSGRVQVIRVILIVSSTEAVTLKIDPSVVLATREYVDISVKALSDESLKIAKNLSDIKDKSAARGALELGTAATKNIGTSTGNVMAVGAFGLGVGPQHREDALSNITQIYRISASSASAPGGSTYGVICLPCDGAPSAGYLAAGLNGELHVGRSGMGVSGVAWSRVYTTGYKPTAADVGAITRDVSPVGIPQPWPTATAPTGWLKCNGATFDKSKYPLLASVYPNGRLPDLRGEFIRGWDDGRGIDPNRGVGSFQAATGISPALGSFDFGGGIGIDNGESGVWHPTYFRYSVTGFVGDGVEYKTVRPRNIAFNYIVRAA